MSEKEWLEFIKAKQDEQGYPMDDEANDEFDQCNGEDSECVLDKRSDALI